jgi:hypothetical protein
MENAQTTSTSTDPTAGFPGNASITADASLIRETDRALQVQLADGRTVWVPKSVGRMDTIRKTPLGFAMRDAAAGMRVDASKIPMKSVVVMPVWLWRKLPAA